MQSSTLSQKIKFLKSKGLTDVEIELAIERAQIFTKPSDGSMAGHTEINMQTTRYQLQAPSKFERFKSLFTGTAFIGSLVYAAYLFYKVSIYFSYLFVAKEIRNNRDFLISEIPRATFIWKEEEKVH